METTIQLFNEVSLSYDADGNANIGDSRTVFASVCSIGSNEFYKAAVNGLKASKMFKVFFADYKAENMAQFNHEIFAIYRTYYDEKSDKYELYCNEV